MSMEKNHQKFNKKMFNRDCAFEEKAFLPSDREHWMKYAVDDLKHGTGFNEIPDLPDEPEFIERSPTLLDRLLHRKPLRYRNPRLRSPHSVFMTEIQRDFNEVFWHEKRMLEAVLSNDKKCLRTLFEKGFDANEKLDLTTSPSEYAVVAAVENNCLVSLKMLSDAGADFHLNEKFGGKNLLHIAASLRPSSPDLVCFLIEKGFDVNEKTSDGDTPLHLAARNANLPEVLKVLIEAGADTDATDKSGKTPLLVSAAYNQNPRITRFLLEQGLNPEACDTDGANALLLAARFNRKPLAIIKEIRKHNVNLLVADKNARNELHYAADNKSPAIGWSFYEKLNNDTAFKNLATNPDVNGVTPEQLFEKNLEIPTQQGLLYYYIDWDSNQPSWHKGRTRFHDWASGVGTHSEKLFHDYLDIGLDVNAKDVHGKTPLFYAKLQETKLLLGAGADLNIKDNRGNTVLSYAVSGAKSGLQLLNTLIDAGADIHTTNNEGMTLMHLAASHFKIENMRILAERGLDINIKNAEGDTPLFLVARLIFGFGYKSMTAQGFHCVLHDFLDMGADIHARGRHGATLLHEAALAENPEYARFFLEQGLTASATDDKGRTALHYAATSESRTVYDWLLAREEFKSLAEQKDAGGHAPSYYLDHKSEW